MKKMLARAVLAAIFYLVFMAVLGTMQRKGYGLAETLLVILIAIVLAFALWWAIGELSR